MMGFKKLLSNGNLLKKVVKYNCVVARNTCNVSASGGENREGEAPDENKKGVVLCVYENNGKYELTPAAQEMDQKSEGKLSQHLNELSGELKLGKAFVLTHVTPEYWAVGLASVGPKDAAYNELENLDEARENVRWGVGAAVRALSARGCSTVAVDAAQHQDAAAEAAHLAAWRFQQFKSCPDRAVETRVVPLGAGGGGEAGGSSEWAQGAEMGRAQNWARYLSDMPANKMAPVDFAQAVLNKLCPLGVRVVARDRSWLHAQRMEAFLAVARGSCEAPVLLECSYRGAHDSAPPLLLAAKGVTFDSGGLCLKRREHMVENRGSMAGAAVAVAALHVLATNKAAVNVTAVIPLCENMVSGQCMKVGDVVRALNGLSIQIENTDMEGRLMLADALVYGQSVYKPALVVDVATFTTGVLTSTGGGAFAAMTAQRALWQQLAAAGARTGDRAWRLPLWNYYSQHITNDQSVDLRNEGSSKASTCVGAAFLRNFICGPWIHLDITGVGMLSHDSIPYLTSRRMSGRPARTLAQFIMQLAEGSNPAK